jgi:hypothetical protein
MHLSDQIRTDLLDGLDRMLSAEHWEPEMPLPGDSSMATLLAFVIHLEPQRLPSVGASDARTFVASWRDAEADLFVEFLPDRRVRWVTSRTTDKERERLAGITEIESLAEALAGIGAKKWIGV